MTPSPIACASYILASFLLLSTIGCAEQSDEVEVSGNITIDGEPISQGTISFVAVDGIAATGGGVIKDGVYTARVLPGEKSVMVLGNKLVGTEPLYEGVPDSPTRNKYETVTPPAYNAAHLTPLKATITEPQDDLDFELTSSVEAS